MADIPTADEAKLRDIVNASGFQFQAAVQQRIESSVALHEWSFVASEYAWRLDDAGGFIDLIFEKGHLRFIIECKRSRSASWVFLVPSTDREVVPLRVHWIYAEQPRIPFAGWDDLFFSRASFQSEFCAVRGSGEQDTPMLERIASRLLLSVEAVAAEEASLLEPRPRTWRVFIPIIVTNAALFLCRYDPAAVTLETGDLAQAKFERVSLIRFRKHLATQHEHASLQGPRILKTLAQAKDRSVLVIHSAALPSILADWGFSHGSPSAPMPWDRFRLNSPDPG